jgi:hypothetical protein
LLRRRGGRPARLVGRSGEVHKDLRSRPPDQQPRTHSGCLTSAWQRGLGVVVDSDRHSRPSRGAGEELGDNHVAQAPSPFPSPGI